MADEQYADLTLERATKLADPNDPYAKQLLAELGARKTSVETEQSRFRQWCDRADNLYYANEIGEHGANTWPTRRSKLPGATYVALNSSAVYVDVPAALQSVEPIENYAASEDSEEARAAASAKERIYYAWKREEKWEIKVHRACIVKGLYGRTAAKVYWDAEKGRPCVEIIDQPRNLYMGYRSDQWNSLEWAAYVTRMDPNAVEEEFGVAVDVRDQDGVTVPYVSDATPSGRSWLTSSTQVVVEVWDYWYRVPKPGSARVAGQRREMQTRNAVFVGNLLVRDIAYDEYEGKLPILPLFNTYVAGVPTGKPDLYDVEPILKEKQARMTGAAQMMKRATAGDAWQLVGPDATFKVPKGLQPRVGEVVGPGPGNRIEAIQPFIPQVQVEQHLQRLDVEASVMTGLNELLKGLSPAQVLSSSKAITALVAQYEARIRMRRDNLYQWRSDVAELVFAIWRKKNADVAKVTQPESALEIIPPSLSPRDDMETATRALNLLNGRVWSQKRAMDAAGVDDPEQELNIIREERADAVVWPEAVELMVRLLQALSASGVQAPGAVQGQASELAGSGSDALRKALGAGTPDNTTSVQGGEEVGQLPPGALTPGAPTPAGTEPVVRPPETIQAQSLIQGGQVKGRIITNQKLGRR